MLLFTKMVRAPKFLYGPDIFSISYLNHFVSVPNIFQTAVFRWMGHYVDYIGKQMFQCTDNVDNN